MKVCQKAHPLQLQIPALHIPQQVLVVQDARTRLVFHLHQHAAQTATAEKVSQHNKKQVNLITKTIFFLKTRGKRLSPRFFSVNLYIICNLLE